MRCIFLNRIANLTAFLLVRARQKTLYNNMRRRPFTCFYLFVEVGLRLIFRVVSFCEDPSDLVVVIWVRLLMVW